MIFADKLTQLRKKAGWSQEELAEQMNVTRQSVSKWENGSSDPNTSNLIALAKLYKISPEDLLSCVENVSEESSQETTAKTQK